jgi:putative membrane protein insertion efficiency factor
MEQIIHLIRKGCCFLIKTYQLVVSPYLNPCCRFYPSCSQYALEAIQHYGVIKGGLLAGRRLLKCHPWSSGGYDPVLPTKETL